MVWNPFFWTIEVAEAAEFCMCHDVMKMITKSPSVACAVCLVALLSLATVNVMGQAAHFTRGDAPQLTPRGMMGDQLITLSFEQIGGVEMPSEAQFTTARMLLEQASQYLPNDSHVWMMRGDLARSSGDMDAWAAAMAAYLKLEPEHDAVLYELLMYQVSQEQTIADRVRRVERILTNAPAGSLSPALQSRLAIYLARAAREQDDKPMMLHWLSQAAKLDKSNQVAAEMMYDLLVSHNVAQDKLDQALMRWLQAAPANPMVRLMMAERCFSTGLYRRAAQQYDMAAQLTQGDLPPEVFQPWITSLIASGQTRDALRMTYSLEASIVASMPERNIADQWSAEGQAEANKEPDMPFSILLLRQVVSASDDRPDAVGRNWQRLVEADKKLAAAENRGSLLSSDLSWYAATYAPQVQVARELVEAIDVNTQAGRVGRLFLAIREGDREGAMKWLGEIEQNDLPAAELGVAMLIEEREDRYRMLQQIATNNPGTLIGALASSMLQAAGQLPSASLEGAKLDTAVRNMSRRLWHSDLQQDPWIILHVTVNRGRYGYLDPIVCEVRVNNNSRAPLALGSDRAIPDSGVLVVNASVNGRDVGRIPPIYFSMFQKLSLQPDQSIKTYVRLDRSLVGLMLSDNASLNFNLRVISVIAPRVQPNLAIIPGPTGMARRIHSVFRLGLTPTPQLLNQWRAAVSDRMNSVERFKAIARLCQIEPLPMDPGDEADSRPRTVSELVIEGEGETRQVRRRLTEEERVVRTAQIGGMEAVASSFATMSELEQAWVVRFVAEPKRDQRSPFEDVLKMASTSDKPLVRMMYLMIHVDSPLDASLDAAINSSNATIKAFATAYKQTLVEREAKQAAAEEAASESMP